MAAYEVRKGNPLKKYRPQDFRFTDSDISLDASGLEIVERQDNMLLVAPTEPDYILKVTGFDTNRNLFVKVTAQ